MTGTSNDPVDVIAILTDLQQQVSDLTGVVEAQQRTLGELGEILRIQDRLTSERLPDLVLPALPPALTVTDGA